VINAINLKWIILRLIQLLERQQFGIKTRQRRGARGFGAAPANSHDRELIIQLGIW
jgi:hypothetical protein